MVSHSSGNRGSTFDSIEPVHLALACRHPPLRSELACVPHAAGMTGKDVCVEREDHLSFVEVVDGVDIFAESQACTRSGIITPERLVLVPLR